QTRLSRPLSGSEFFHKVGQEVVSPGDVQKPLIEYRWAGLGLGAYGLGLTSISLSTLFWRFHAPTAPLANWPVRPLNLLALAVSYERLATVLDQRSLLPQRSGAS